MQTTITHGRVPSYVQTFKTKQNKKKTNQDKGRNKQQQKVPI